MSNTHIKFCIITLVVTPTPIKVGERYIKNAVKSLENLNSSSQFLS